MNQKISIEKFNPMQIVYAKAFVVVFVIFLVSACAPTQVIEQSRDLSTSGLAYTTAVDALLDTTIDRVIEFNSVSLVKIRRGQSEAQLRQILAEHNEGLALLVEQLQNFKVQNMLLRSYFLNLQALADSPVKSDVGGAVATLSGSINELNRSVGSEFELSPEQQASIGQLAGLAAHSAQASRLKTALQRDAGIIATQLAFHEQQLGFISEILQDRFEAENDLFFREKVEKPYADVALFPNPGASWRADREQYLKTRFTSAKLETAQIAAGQLRGVWTDILQGRNDIGSMRILISDVNEFVVSLDNLKQSSQNN